MAGTDGGRSTYEPDPFLPAVSRRARPAASWKRSLVGVPCLDPERSRPVDEVDTMEPREEKDER